MNGGGTTEGTEDTEERQGGGNGKRVNGGTVGRRRGRGKEGRSRPLWQTALLHAVLVALSVVFLIPLLWLIGSSLKTDDQIKAFPPEWLPNLPYYAEGSPYMDAYERAKALRNAHGDWQAASATNTYRALALGDVTFQGEASEGAAQSAVLRDL